MPKVPAFYSVNEASKPASERVYHDNSACPTGREIPQNERKSGMNGYKLCGDCVKGNNQGS